jgi:predicted transcriptional regulator YdeE
MRFMNTLPVFMAIFLALPVLLAQVSRPRIVHGDEFTIIGIEAKTSGEAEMSGDSAIGPLWQRFYQEHVLDKIPNKSDQNIYALYTNYARDRMGNYTVIIGAKVKDKSQVPDGMAAKTIPAGQYAIFTSEKGPGESVIPDAWSKIWALEDKGTLGGDRAYKVDYEVYDSRNTDPKQAQAEIFVGLKDAPAQK